MLTFTQRVSSRLDAQHVVALPYHQRIKGRLRITTEDGLDAGIIIERGTELQHGDKLSSSDGVVLEVRACNERVSVASTDDTLLFSRACYHIGNRHAEVQIATGQLIYLCDAVLDDMLRQLGLSVHEKQLPFSPENGAYFKGQAHSHPHEHHLHEHSHDH